MRLTARSRWLLTLGVVSAVVLGSAAEHALPVVRVAESWSRDLRIATLTAPEPQSTRIAVIAVTEETLAAFPYRSPLDRRFLSNLLRTLDEKGVEAIGLDLLLDQPSERDKDRELLETLHSLSVPVAVASADASDGLTDRQVAFVSEYLDGLPTGIPMLLGDTVDGTVRAVRLHRRIQQSAQPSFVAAVLDVTGRGVPDGDTLMLRFRGAPDVRTPPFATYPAHTVALLPDAWLSDRIALIGVDLALVDRHRTPFSVAAPGGAGDMPGVVLQAHALSQILEGRDPPDAPPWLGIFITVLFALVGAGTIMLGQPVVLKAMVLALGGAALWAGGFMIFERYGQLVPLVAPTLALMLAGGFTYAWRWREEHARRRFVHDAFSRFVSPAVVEQLIDEPERLRLGGERKDVTFLFTDVADYTRLSERTEPSLLVRTMNDYLDGACEIVFEHGGTMDKIVGDALHVIFNAPLEQADHPERAVGCAMALDRFCQDFARRQRALGLEFGVTRIGVNTGVAVVGNFGGEKHFDYTATGDAINTAARLESVNKHIGTRICISATTVKRCKRGDFRPVGELVLKGKSEGVVAYEPAASEDGDRAGLDEYLSAYELLSASDPRAAQAFRDLRDRHPQDALVGFHLKRIEAGESGSVIVMREK